MKVNLYGSIWGCTGYANHTKHLANALCNIGVDVSLQCQVPQGWERVVNDNELKMITKPVHKDGIDLMIDLPQNWRMVSSERRPFVGFFIWEGDCVPEHYMKYLMDENVKQIWVPSKHTKQAILNTWKEPHPELIDKIKIVPHGVDTKIFKPEEPKEKDIFTFLANKGWRHNLDRGGIQYLVKAYLEEFKTNENVELVIKINPAYGIPNIQSLIQQLDIKNENKPSLSFVTQEVNVNELYKIYNHCDVFVSTSMAEAFNLGGLEAMACGKPTLQTTFGGQKDYMSKLSSWGLDKGKLIPVNWEIMYEEVKWFLPDIDDIKKKLRYCFENQDEVKEKGKQALIESKEWTWKKSAEKAKICLKEITNDN